MNIIKNSLYPPNKADSVLKRQSEDEGRRPQDEGRRPQKQGEAPCNENITCSRYHLSLQLTSLTPGNSLDHKP